jgi:hypothetical protein
VTQSAGARTPYALRPIAFPLPALAALGARAALGGPRETALACLLAVRLVIDMRAPVLLNGDARAARAQQAKHWFGAATLAAPARVALVALVDASAGDDPRAAASALESVIAVTANQLDPAARLELNKLLQTLAE